MATLTTRPYMTVSITVADKSAKSVGQFHISNGASQLGFALGAADFTGYLEDLLTSIEAVSDCSVMGVTVSQEYIVASPQAMTGSPEVERKGVMSFRTADGFFTRFSWGGLKNAALAEDGIKILRAGTDFGGTLENALQDIYEKILNGPTVTLTNYPSVDRRGSELASLDEAYQQHRKSLLPQRAKGG